MLFSAEAILNVTASKLGNTLDENLQVIVFQVGFGELSLVTEDFLIQDGIGHRTYHNVIAMCKELLITVANPESGPINTEIGIQRDLHAIGSSFLKVEIEGAHRNLSFLLDVLAALSHLPCATPTGRQVESTPEVVLGLTPFQIRLLNRHI